ncbi:MAG: HU family DNA-binding protein [Eubacteriales bacterium]|nr:HU family DNA-binding protein [Eubacteriales bacterium]
MAADAVDTVVTLISEGLEQDGKVSLKYFGRFEIKPFKAHKGYDFTEKKSIQIPAHNTIRFTPCEALRKEVLRKEIHRNDK